MDFEEDELEEDSATGYEISKSAGTKRVWYTMPRVRYRMCGELGDRWLECSYRRGMKRKKPNELQSRLLILVGVV